MAGELTTIVGPMGSGKTRYLFGLFAKYQAQGYEIQLFKHQIDNRDKEPVCSSRAGHAFPATVIRDTSEIDPKILLAPSKTVLALEEGEFFASDLVDFVRRVARLTQFRVIVTGLNLDFKGDPFGYMPQLMALADNLVYLYGECDVCHGFATKTQRFIDGKPASADSPLILIGGDESYSCRCPSHFVLLS